MDRVVLLALLGIPILVAVHAAGVMFPMVDQASHGLQWNASWQSPHPTYFVVEQIADRRV